MTSSTVGEIVAEAPCDVALVTLPGEVGRPVALATGGPDDAAVVRRVGEFASLDGTVPTVLAVASGGETERSARERATDLVADVAAATGRSPDDYVVDVFDGASDGGLADALGEYETVCVGYAGKDDSNGSIDGIVERVARNGQNVAVVRSSAGVSGESPAGGPRRDRRQSALSPS